MRTELKALAAGVAVAAAMVFAGPVPANAYQMQHGEGIRDVEGELMAVWCMGPCGGESAICCKSAYDPT